MRQRMAIRVAVLLAAFSAGCCFGQPPGPYDHNRFGTSPVDIQRDFIAFTVSFDGDDNGVRLAVPEWVAYELRATPDDLGDAPPRPGTWSTDDDLFIEGIAPDDNSYKNSGYSRGHMCMKSHAHRISDEADTETHTVLNACPQLQSMNAGVWLGIENLTGAWADEFGAVWIICGPIFYSNMPIAFIGDPGEVPVALPDAFYKIVVKDDDDGGVDVLAFLVPMEGDENHTKQSGPFEPYLTSVDAIEALTGLDFLTVLPDDEENSIEKRVWTVLWE